MKKELNYIDEIYEYKGKWGVASKCGIKIIKNDDKHIIIATELYDENPGTSVTNWNCTIAASLCAEKGLDPQRLVFIEHTPDRGSKLENYRETFDRVMFQWDGKNFSNPDWQSLSREDVQIMIGEQE